MRKGELEQMSKVILEPPTISTYRLESTAESLKIIIDAVINNATYNREKMLEFCSVLFHAAQTLGAKYVPEN